MLKVSTIHTIGEVKSVNTFLDDNNNCQIEQPSKILTKLVNEKFSGKITIVNSQDESVKWRIFMGNGKVHFATSMMGKKERLQYLLGHYFNHNNYEIPNNIQDDYQFLCNLWHTDKVGVQQVRQIITKITQECLIQCLALPQTNIELESTVGLNPLLVSMPVKDLIVPVRNQIRYWVQMRSEISSPFQRPLVENLDELKSQTWINEKYYNFAEKLKVLVNDHWCLYEIANHFRQHILEVAVLLHPLINAGVVKMLPYKLPQQDNRPIVACIDDSKSIQKIVKMTLEMNGYKVVNILEPATAMSNFVTEKPNLILMDINMPNIDGYKLSYMFRQSTLLQDIPIIMLTGRDGIVDRVRAKMVGAVNYISKPFVPQELLNIVNSYIGVPKQ